MLTTPFLTQIDSRAAIKGSRDPLGVQSIWARLGRHVVGNLTTVSGSVTDFTVLLLGYYFAERVAHEGGTEGDLATFLKWEQLAAYARASVNDDWSFRGTERVARNLNEGRRVRLAVDGSAQILSNQKIYGLWGLYSVPARASGLVEGDPARLTPEARALVETVYLPAFAAAGLRDGRVVVDRLRGPEHALDLRERSKDRVLVEAVASILSGKLRGAERAVYREHLLHGGRGDRDRTRGLQRVFADVLETTLDEPDWKLTPEAVATMATRARERGAEGEALAHRLERIRACELLLAPAAALFEYVLGCDGQAPTQIADAIRSHWESAFKGTLDLPSIEALEPELRAWSNDAESGARWVKTSRALAAAQYEDALHLLLDQNAAMMKARSAAAPWAVVREGKLQVRFRDEQTARLPAAGELRSYWRHAYFIESLRNVAGALRGRS